MKKALKNKDFFYSLFCKMPELAYINTSRRFGIEKGEKSEKKLGLKPLIYKTYFNFLTFSLFFFITSVT